MCQLDDKIINCDPIYVVYVKWIFFIIQFKCKQQQPWILILIFSLRVFHSHHPSAVDGGTQLQCWLAGVWNIFQYIPRRDQTHSGLERCKNIKAHSCHKNGFIKVLQTGPHYSGSDRLFHFETVPPSLLQHSSTTRGGDRVLFVFYRITPALIRNSMYICWQNNER